jgi:hypothetical protein
MHRGIAVAALALAVGVTPMLGAQGRASGKSATNTETTKDTSLAPGSRDLSKAEILTQDLLPWIQGLGIPALLLAWLNRSGKGLPGVRKKRSPREVEVLSSTNFSQAIETDPELKQLVSEARHALVFETTFGTRAEAGCRAALTAFWRDSNGRFTMPEIGRAATHVRWDRGEFTYRGLIARRVRGALWRLRRWTRHHFWVISLIDLVFLGVFFYFDMLPDYEKPNRVVDLVDIGAACYIVLAAVLADLWLRKLEVIDELVEWSRRAKANSGPALVAVERVAPIV